MLKIKTKFSKITTFLIASSILSLFFFPLNLKAIEYTLNNTNTAETWQINQDINEKRSEIQELKRQINIYQQNISAKQHKLNNLTSQVSVISDSIAKINLEVASVQLEIESVQLEIENTQLKIQSKETEITEQKEVLGEVLRTLHRQQQRNNILEILILNDNFSDFLGELNRLEDMQDSLFNQVEDLNEVKLALNSDQNSLQSEETELNTLGDILKTKKSTLDGQKMAKYNLMSITQGQETKYRELLDQAKEEQEQINNDIVYLEKIARQKLNRQLALEEISSDGLMWPIGSRLITAYFHDPTYPYRYIFEHPAIDVATPQGTALRAAESGYVAKIRAGGTRGYSYIMIVHANGLSTVYSHVNKINVSTDQFVSKGQIIGATGGMPGTSGAGLFSTGPHLHFETRLNGIPVNPLNYLP